MGPGSLLAKPATPWNHGVDDYAEVADSPNWDFGNADFSIELWANFRSLRASSLQNPAAVFVGSDEGSGAVNKWLFSLGGGVLNFHLNSPTMGPKFLAQAPFAPALNQWYHLALTRGANLYEIFVNGVRIGSELNTEAVPNAAAPLTIGHAEGIGHMDGWIDELSIYRRALERRDSGDFRGGPCGQVQWGGWIVRPPNHPGICAQSRAAGKQHGGQDNGYQRGRGAGPGKLAERDLFFTRWSHQQRGVGWGNDHSQQPGVGRVAGDYAARDGARSVRELFPDRRGGQRKPDSGAEREQ